MSDKEIDRTDRIVIGASTLLILFGVVVLGIVEMLDGEPYVAQPITNDAGDIIAQPGVDPAIRTGLVMAGIALFALYGLYKVVIPDTETS
ncbi:MAG: hypothetical protein V5A34_05300 [Halapricum sp.]